MQGHSLDSSIQCEASLATFGLIQPHVRFTRKPFAIATCWAVAKCLLAALSNYV